MPSNEIRIRARDSAKTNSRSAKPERDELQKSDEYSLKGLWRSELGSLYSCDGRSFTCVSVHSSEFRGWPGKLAVRDIHQVGDAWFGWQAFRNPCTGALGAWDKISLTVSRDLVTKFMNPGAGRLIYGRVESYYRVTLN